MVRFVVLALDPSQDKPFHGGSFPMAVFPHHPRFLQGAQLLLCAVGALVAFLEWSDRNDAVSKLRFEAPAPRALSDEPLSTFRVSVDSPVPSVHSASAIELSDGAIRAYWFGGTREGAKDVSIWTADFSEGTWGKPRIALDRHTLARGTGRYLRKLGNPVAHLSEDGSIRLFVVSVSFGGWSGSAINEIVFEPDGESIRSMQRLVASPFINLGTLVRGAALEFDDGDLLLPAYHEVGKKFPQLLRVDESGRVTNRTHLPYASDLFQPWLLAGGSDRLEMFLRRGEDAAAQVYYAETSEKIDDWNSPETVSIENPNAGLSAVHLDDGSYLLAANPTEETRNRLELLSSPSPAGPWKTVLVVDDEKTEPDEKRFDKLEYSYPWLMKDSRGVVHLFYTWNRAEIRHLVIGQKQLMGKGGPP